jgi:uncharacterized protein (TIGR04255 family)
MALNIPESKREVFKSHTIVRCIVRLDFEDVFDVSDLAKSIIPEISNKYPQRRKENAINLKILSKEQDSNKDNDDVIKESVYVFFNEDNNSIKLGNTFILIDCSNYINFDDLLEIFKTLLNKLTELYPDNKYRRLGLRKINAFFEKETENNLASFEDKLNEFYTDHLNKNVFDSALREDYHKISVPDLNDMEMLLQFRTDKGHKDNENNRRFILDIDFFTINIEEKDIEQKLKDLNSRLFDVYVWSIKDKLKNKLRDGVCVDT